MKPAKLRSALVLILPLFLNSLSAHALASGVKTKAAFGDSTQVEGNKVILDRAVVIEFAKQPSLRSLERNPWEVIYFVMVGDEQAANAAIDLISLINPAQVKADGYSLIHPLAWALTRSDYSFWQMLAKRPLAVRRKVVGYFDAIPNDYTGHDYQSWKRDTLK